MDGRDQAMRGEMRLNRSHCAVCAKLYVSANIRILIAPDLFAVLISVTEFMACDFDLDDLERNRLEHSWCGNASSCEVTLNSVSDKN